MSRPDKEIVLPTSISSYRRNGASGDGISLKSGQIAQLKRWLRMISIVARWAWTVSGLVRMPPTVSTRNGIEATWSRCEWVRKMQSMSESSASDRSPTPVPASIRTSLSNRKEVVRKCRPPIPPEQPRTRSFTAPPLFLVECRHTVPVGRRRRAALFRDFLRIRLVELAGGIHALQVEQAQFDLIPPLRAVMPQRLVPHRQLVVRFLVHCGLEPDRLVNGYRLVLALHLDAVDLAEYDVLDGVARGFADQNADAVALGAAFEAGGDVDRIAHRRVRASHPRPHVPDPHGTGIPADVDLVRRPAARGELGVQPLALVLHLDGGEHTVARVLRIVHRRAPERHDRIADVLVERAAVLTA